MSVFPEFICAIANDLEVLANLAIIFFAFRFAWRNSWVNINLSVGTVRLRRKDVNASNLTNVVSSAFYEGGFLPAPVRNEVIAITNPAYKAVRKG